MSNLIASLWRAQTFAYLAYHISWFLFGFYPCEELELGSSSCQALAHPNRDFIRSSCCVLDVGFWCLSCSSWQAQVLRKRFYFGKLLAFSVAEILPVRLWGKSHTLLSFQQSWFHLIRSSFAKVIAVLVWLFWTGLLGPDISFHRNFRFPNSSKKSAKERRKRGAGLNRKLWSDILMTRNFRVALKEPRVNG